MSHLYGTCRVKKYTLELSAVLLFGTNSNNRWIRILTCSKLHPMKLCLHLELKSSEACSRFRGYADWQKYGPSGDALAAFFATGIRSSTGSAKSLGLTVETHVQGFVCCRCRKETKSPSTWMLLVASLICSCFFSLSPCFYAFGLINDSLYISSSHPYGADFFCQAIALVRSLVCTLFNCLKAMKSPSRCGKKTQSWSRNILSNLGKMKKLY